ncbi:hypothetical protein WHR41_08129 [Cladosporium halotolerans]|uniref:MARVEL domain-containing protein n=1 Tax=Cladosporium halotolerans TaxID=1052096 RepID=A0AB34KFX6_9PEZI
MAISGFLFLSWRIFQIILLVPVVGMLSWFVHGYVESNQLTPNFILVLFIVSVLALAWTFATLFNYLRARHDAFFVALIDLGFVGALIGGVVTLRGIADADCSSFSAGSLYVDLGPFGYFGRQSDSPWAVNISKNCAMLKASWAMSIILILTFFVTFLLALLVHRNHRNDDRVVVKREYHTSRHGHRRSSSRGGSRSRYGDDSRARSSGGRSHSRRRQYYV